MANDDGENANESLDDDGLDETSKNKILICETLQNKSTK